MLVCDEDAVELVGLLPDARQPLQDFALGEPGID